MKVGLKQLHITQFLLYVSFEKENLQGRRMGQWLSEVTSVGKINEGAFPIREIWGVMELFCILIVMVIAGLYALVKTHRTTKTNKKR